MTNTRASSSEVLLFGRFRFDTAARELSALDHDGTGVPVTIGSRALDLLSLLIDRRGRLVSKDEIMDAVWRGVIVEEANLTVQIAALRRILDRGRKADSCIRTVSGRGYRFVAPVVAEAEKGATPAQASVDAERHPAPTPHDGAERRQITALSCELAGMSTRDDVDLEDLRAAVGAFRRCVLETVGRHDGFIASDLGNTALVLFGYPAAHEHDAEQAVRAGLELCRAVKRLRPDANRPMRCRVGIATGVVIIGDLSGRDTRHDREIVGDAPSLAGRLQLSAQPDTVAIEPATRQLIANLFDCRELGAVNMTAGAEPIRIWHVLDESFVASRFEALHPAAPTPLVGREEEIELLLRRWRQAKRGEGQLVLLSGEPGIGKSRIAAVLLEKIETEPHARLRCFCSPHHAESAHHPIIGHLEHAAGFEREDGPAARLEKLAVRLAQTATTAEEIDLFAELLSLPIADPDAAVHRLTPRQKKERTFTALVRQLEALTRAAPVLLLFEDVHWADPSSCELLDRVVERVPYLPVLLVVSFRPEYHPPWTGLPNTSLLALARLGRREAAVLVEKVAGKNLPRDVINRIVDRTDGVPLFVEEVTKGVLESGLLREEADRYVLAAALPPPAIPTTLQASLRARLDRLGSARRLAQIGAAIGREFTYALVHAVSGLPEDELRTSLARLVASELVSQRGTPPDAVYNFKHALVQDAAHGSLLRNSRQQLHAQIAEALESHSPELMYSQPELFAQHYAEAGLVEKSVAFWGKAGHRSTARSAMTEAAAQFHRGLDQLALLPDTPERQRQELEFWSALGLVFHILKGPAGPETGHAYARARDLWEQSGSPTEFLQIPFGQSRYHGYRGELDLALRLDADLLRLSRQRDDPRGLVLGHFSYGRNLMLAGRLAVSRPHLEEALALSDPIFHRSVVHQAGIYPQVNSQAVLGISLFCLGFPDQALTRSNEAVAEARRLAHPPSLAVSLAFGTHLLLLVGDNAALDQRVDQLVAVATEQGFSHYKAVGAIFRGSANCRNGEVTEGISLLRSGSVAYRATGAENWMPYFVALLAEAYEIAGQVDAAVTLATEALQIVERTGERWFAAELNRHKGQLLLRQGQPEAAEELYRKALGIAREQEAKLWELRAATSLARLWSEQGRQGEARDLLGPVYGWFTEGFDTPDLKVAKALLDCLQPAPGGGSRVAAPATQIKSVDARAVAPIPA